MWLVFAVASAFFAGITAVLSKVGIKNLNSNLGTAIRTVVVLIFAWLMVFVVGAQGEIYSVKPKTLIFLILSGFATGASWLCYFKALKSGDVNIVAPIDKSSTILTMLLAFIFLREKITYLKAFCIVLIGVGTYLMIEKRKTGENITEKSNRFIIWAAASAVFAALTSILGKIGISDIDSTLGTAIRTVVVLIMAWVVVFVTKSGSIENCGGKRNCGGKESKNNNRRTDTIKGGKTDEIDTNGGSGKDEIRTGGTGGDGGKIGTGDEKRNCGVTKKDFVFLVLSGITTGLSWLCYYKALQDGPASVVVPIDKLSILITVIFSYVILKEKLTKKALAGLILLISGTLLLLV